MGKLSSELCENENNTDTSFYPLYLPKLHKDILKYFRLNLVKEIPIGFNHGFKMTLESSSSFFNSLLV